MRVRATDLAWQEVDDEIIVLDSASSLYIRLGGVAPDLWPLLVAGTDADALTQTLVDTYAIDADRARADVAAFLAGLAERSLIEDQP